MADAEEYKRQVMALLPRGLAWYFEEDKNFPKLFQAFGDECANIDGAAQSFIEDFFPDTTSGFLPDWERVAGLPDECSGLATSIALRRKDLLARLTSVGGQTIQYLIDQALAAGYTITITEVNPFKAGISKAGDPDYGEGWQFAFFVHATLNEITFFKAGINAAGDPLAIWGDDRLECLINRLKPAHTIPIFSYT